MIISIDVMNLLMFGKPLVGRPMAPLAIRTAPMTRRLGCGSDMLWPTCCTSGSTISAATVWLMKVAMTRIRPQKTTSTPYKLIPSTLLVMDSAMVCNRPEELTDLPSARPPAARMMMVHKKLLKSSLVRMPVPKNNTSGIIAITPMSPKMSSSWWLTHQRMMVTTVTILINHWTPVNLSFIGRIGTIVVPLPGWKVRTSRPQIKRIEMMHTGSATKNQMPQEGSGFMF